LKSLKIDLSKFGKGEWLGCGAFYIFTWLSIFILSINPPFYDPSPPKIEVVALPMMQEVGGNVLIVAKVTDNVGVNEKGLNLSIACPNGTIVYPESTFENDILSSTYENDDLLGKFEFKITAIDVNDRKAEKNGTFEYSNDAIKLAFPENGSNVKSETPIRFLINESISEENFRVYYTIDEGDEINVTKSGNYYETSPKMKGWKRNATIKMRIYVEVIHYFMGQNETSNNTSNTVIDNEEYYFSVEDGKVGTEQPPEIKGLPKPESFQRTPGFGLFATIMAIFICAILGKRIKKKHKNNE
jgi:hypothetical protein